MEGQEIVGVKANGDFISDSFSDVKLEMAD